MYSLKIFFKLLKRVQSKRKSQLFFLIFFSILSSFIEIISIASIIPFAEIMLNSNSTRHLFIQKILNFLSVNDEYYKLSILLIFIILTIFSYIFRIFLYGYSHQLTNSITKELVNKSFSKIIYQDYYYFVSANKSKFTSVLEKIGNTQSFMTCLIILTINVLLIIGLLFFVVFVSGFETAFVFLVIGSLFLIFGLVLKKLIQKLGKNFNLSISHRYFIINETFKNIKQLILYNSQNLFLQNFKKINSKYYKNILKNHLINSIPNNTIALLVITIIAISIFFFSNQNNGIIEHLPHFAAILYSIQKVIVYYSFVLNSYNKINWLIPSSLEVLKILSYEKIIFTNISQLKFDNFIKIENGIFKYPQEKKELFLNINLQINKNEKIFISGNSGSGKSTLLDLICGLLKFNSGGLYVDNALIIDKNLLNWFTNISYTQQTSTFLDNNILNNIIFNEDYNNINYERLNKVSEMCELEKAFNTSNFFEINLGEDGLKISGGQKQRIALARSLYKNRDLLILDESTNSLDEKSEENIIKNIFENYKNKTILITSHNLMIKKNVDREIIIKDGYIKESVN